MAGRTGLGAVMGSKKLKAVVAERAQAKIAIADSERLKALSKSIYEMAQKAMPTLSSGGTASGYPILYRGGQVPVRNYTTNIFPEYEKFGPDYLRTRFNVTPTSCWACRISHCRMTEVTEGPYKGYVGEEPEYEVLAGMSATIGNTDPGATVMLGNEIDRLGLDGHRRRPGEPRHADADVLGRLERPVVAPPGRNGHLLREGDRRLVLLGDPGLDAAGAHATAELAAET